MRKYKIEEVIEAWDIFMGLCEEFPELYGKYAEKVEKDLKMYQSEIKITEEEKKQVVEKIWSRIKNEACQF